MAEAEAKAKVEYEKAIAEPIAIYERAVAAAVATARAIYDEAIAEPREIFDRSVAEAEAQATAFEWRFEAHAEALEAARKARSETRKNNAEDAAIKSLIDAQNRLRQSDG